MDPMVASHGMGTSIEYEVVAVGLSAFAFVLSIVYAFKVTKTYRQFHDDRAAVSLFKGLGLLVISLGLLISALGLLAGGAIMSIAGLSVARGAFVVLMLTLLLAGVRPKGRRDE